MIELGLSRIHQLLARTPFTWRAIHVAGTNGKGSVCAYISAMLDHYNSSHVPRVTGHDSLRYGRFTSPHLIDRWDCITIDGNTVDESLFKEVESAVKRRNITQEIKASEFEILTATAFELFNQARIDVGIVEVGMGGRLDATNVIGQISEHDRLMSPEFKKDAFRPAPLLTVISSIGLDHQAFLGDTINDIAREKAGILKADVPVIVAAEDDEAMEAVKSQAMKTGAGIIIPVTTKTTPGDIWCPQTELLASHAGGPAAMHTPIQTRWPNGAIAVQAAWQSLLQMGRLTNLPEVDHMSLLLSMCAIPEKTLWPGRLQLLNLEKIIGLDPPAILDGAHNAQSARLLAKFVREQYPNRTVHWLLAASAGKDIDTILRQLLRDGDAVSAVEFGPVDGMPWVQPMPSQYIMDRASECASIYQASCHGHDITGALAEASRLARSYDRGLVIAGSLYLVSDVMRLHNTTN